MPSPATATAGDDAVAGDQEASSSASPSSGQYPLTAIALLATTPLSPESSPVAVAEAEEDEESVETAEEVVGGFVVV